MPRFWTTVSRILTWIAAAATLTACSLVDDDLDDCSKFQVNYELHLVTNIQTELEAELTLQNDLVIDNLLREHLKNIFTDHANDVDLSFYDTQGDSTRLQHRTEPMEASQRTYSLTIPRRHYHHLAVANIAGNTLTEMRDVTSCHKSRLASLLPSETAGYSTAAPDTIKSHDTGLFTARADMDIKDDEEDQVFNVHLYMANCASALIIDPQGNDVRSVKAYATGFATGFAMADSAFVYSPMPPVVEADYLGKGANGSLCFCTVNYPSREPAPSATRLRQAARLTPRGVVIETTDPFVSTDSEAGLWQLQVFVTLGDGSVTKSVLNMSSPLRAGQLKSVHARINGDGSVSCTDTTIGISVTLHWNDGGSHDVTM